MLAIVEFYYKNKIYGFEVFTMVTVKGSCVSSVVMPCSVKVRWFGGMCRLHLKGKKKKICQARNQQ